MSDRSISYAGAGVSLAAAAAQQLFPQQRGLWLLAFLLGISLLMWALIRELRRPILGLRLRYPIMSTLLAAVIGACVFSGVWWLLPRLFKPSTDSAPQQASAKTEIRESATAVFMETRMIGLPLTIPPGGVLRVVSLNKRRITSTNAVNWGFYDVHNDSTKERKWPDLAVMEKAMKAHDPGVFSWRADVTNHGTTAVIDLSIPIKLWFDTMRSLKLFTRR